MKWVDPGALWLLGLALPIAALFLYRRRAVSLTVPSIQFWQPSGHPSSVYRLGRYFANLPTLLAALLILSLLVTALAGPFRPRQGEYEFIVVIDAQATMQTLESNGQTRLELAKRQALRAVADAPRGAVFSLVRAGMHAEIVLARCDDRIRVKTVIRAMEADDTESELAPALELANSLRSAGRQTHLLVLSDFLGHASVDPAAFPSGLDLRRIGGDRPNVGIASLSRSEAADELRVRLHARGMPGREVALELSRVGVRGMPIETLAARSITLNGRGAELLLPCRLGPGVPFRVDVSPDDALPLDNTGWGVWPRDSTLRVRLVTRGNAFLQAALSADPAVHLEMLHPQAWPPRADAELTIFDASPPARSSLTPGRYIMFGRADPFGLVLVAPSLKRTDLEPTNWAGDHPALQDVDLASWKVAASAGLEVPPGARTIVASGKTALVFEVRPARTAGTGDERRPAGSSTDSGETTVAVFFNFALGDSNLVLRPTFPVLLWNTIDYLLGREEWDRAVAHKTGSPISRRRLKQMEMAVTDPDGNRGLLTTQGDRWHWTNTRRQGLYRLEWNGGQEWIALNCMTAGLTAPPEVRAADVAPPARADSARSWWSELAAGFSKPWRLLLAAALVLVVVEWLLTQLRVLRI